MDIKQKAKEKQHLQNFPSALTAFLVAKTFHLCCLYTDYSLFNVDSSIKINIRKQIFSTNCSDFFILRSLEVEPIERGKYENVIMRGKYKIL